VASASLKKNNIRCQDIVGYTVLEKCRISLKALRVMHLCTYKTDFLVTNNPSEGSDTVPIGERANKRNWHRSHRAAVVQDTSRAPMPVVLASVAPMVSVPRYWLSGCPCHG